MFIFVTVKPVCNDHLYNKKIFPVIYSVMCFNEDWNYQFILYNNFCLPELIYVAFGQLDELQQAEKYPNRWSLYTGLTVSSHLNVSSCELKPLIIFGMEKINSGELTVFLDSPKNIKSPMPFL